MRCPHNPCAKPIRFRPKSKRVLACRMNGMNIAEYDQLELTELLEELTKNIKDPLGASIALQAIPHVKQLVEMGLGYLSLSRKVGTLSGGEAQRVKIARHLGSSLNNLTIFLTNQVRDFIPKKWTC